MRIEGSQFNPILTPIRLAPLLSSLISDMNDDLSLDGAPVAEIGIEG